MREMKECGFSSFGVIPTWWKVQKLKTIVSLRSERNSGDRELLSVYLDRGVISYADSTGMQVHKPSQDLSNYQNVYVGDFVLNNQQAWRGSVGVSEYNGIISPAYFVYRLSKDCHPSYMNYLFRDSTMVQQYEIASRGVGTIQRNIFAPWLLNCLAVIPPYAEQEYIANFLDRKCAEIDALFADIRAQIDTLEQYKRSVITEAVTKGLNPDVEMKDSGVFYMAPMNSNWRLTKIGHICSKLSRPFEPDNQALICSNKGKVLPRPEDVTGIMVSEDNAMQGICVGDIAIHGMDTWHGAIAISNYDGKITRVVHVCDSTEEKRFVAYYLQHLAFQGVYKLISNGVRGNTSDFRSWDKVRNIYIALPKSFDEQIAICDYLDHICAEIDSIIVAKKTQLESLDAYKKSLIFEYVTGKKEVPAAITAIAVNPQIILLAKIIDLLNAPKGKIYNQKLHYFCNTLLGLGLDTQYYRYPHGPYDLALDSYINTMVSNGWYDLDTRGGAQNLARGKNYSDFLKMYGTQFLTHESNIKALVDYFRPMSRRQIERFATLFAVWNDFIIDGIMEPSDDQIIGEVLTNWTENKKNFRRSTWQDTLDKMKRQGIVPKGLGFHTLPMPEGGMSDA